MVSGGGYSDGCENIGSGDDVKNDNGINVLIINLGEAVFARCLSSLKDERVDASKQLKGPSVTKYSGNKKEFVEHIRKVQCRMKDHESIISSAASTEGYG